VCNFCIFFGSFNIAVTNLTFSVEWLNDAKKVYERCVEGSGRGLI
jgi:hypothetical protein